MPKSMLGKALAAVAVLLALVGAGLAGLYFFLPTAQFKAQAERALERQIGRDVTLAGAFRPSLYPVLGFRAEDVRIANAPGGRSEHLATARAAAIGVHLLPLLNGRVIVDEAVLLAPAISLEIDAQGRPNWILTPEAGAPRSRGPAPGRQTSDFSLRILRIEDGAISQNDFRTNAGWRVEDVDVRSSVASLDAPMAIEGAVTYRGQRVELDVSRATPRALMRGAPSQVEIALRSAPLVAQLRGELTPGASSFVGEGSLSGGSLRQAAAWLGQPIGEGAGLGAFSFAGRISAAPRRLSLENATFALDEVRGRGDILIETGPAAPPLVSGRLEVQALDLNPYLAGATVAAASSSQEPVAAIASGVDLRAATYDGRPVDLSGMRTINASLELTTGPFRFQRMRADRAQLSLVLNRGFLAATLNALTLYGGSGSGRFEIDARTDDLRLVQELVADNVDVNALLSDAIGFAQLEGRGEVGMRLSSEGRSQADFMSSMDGRIHVEVVSGAIRGVDLGGIARTIRNALSGELVAPGARSPFTGMSATWVLADGVAATDSLSMNTRDLAIRGVGIADLNARTVDLRIVPRQQGVAIPFRMQGGWSRLSFTSDLRGRARPEVEAKVREVQARARDQR